MYIFLVIAVVVILGFVILISRSNRVRKVQQATVESYVSEIFSAQLCRPDVKAGFTYGIPSFSLKFKTDKEKEHAISNGLTKQFLTQVQGLCGHMTLRGEEFEAEQAVSIYSVEDEKRWSEQAAKYRDENTK
jgi:hypothetical protein